MSSNDQNASASPEHAGQQPKVSTPAATSDVADKIEPITQKASPIVIVKNDESDAKKSPSPGIPASETQTSADDNITKSRQSPKDASTSPLSRDSSLSSQQSANSGSIIVSTNYHSSEVIDQYVHNEPRNENQGVLTSARRMAADSLGNSANTYSNRNINDRSSSFSDDHTGQSPVSRYRPQKYCAVCGDKAIACNFNAVTCESCKAFFRRNAFKEHRLKCLFDGRCVVDKVTRRFCSKCRLIKCFQIGMKREWILTDEQKQIKRVKILQNKQSKHHQQQQQVSTSVGDIGSRPRSGGSATSASTYLGQIVDESREEDRYNKRQRTSSWSNYDSNLGRAQKCDASTSCPDEADLLSGQILHHCTMAHQCQYCSLRLQSHGHPVHTVDQYQANYRFHPSHRQYYDYNQRQQQDYHHQQQQHFRYSQHAGHHYVGSQAGSSAYSQHQMAAALKTNADVMNAAYAANMANGSANDATQPAASASQQAASNVACAVPQTTGDCCCPPFVEIFQSQRYNQPPPPDTVVTGTMPIIDHFPNHSPTGSNGSCGSGQVGYLEAQASSSSLTPSNSVANKTNSSIRTTGAIESAMSTADPALSPEKQRSNANSANNSNPFVKALNAQQTSLNVSPTSMDLVITGNSSDNQKEKANSLVTNDITPPKVNGTQSKGTKSEISNAANTTNVIDATKLAVANKQTLPDGTPIDVSKHVVWNGIVYAQPAIAESEMRARVEMIDFTETERQLVYEMIDAIKYMFEPTTTDRSFNDESLNDFVYFCDAALRRLIKTVKQIRAFRILGMEDQIMLLKTACFKILLLRSCLHYHDDIEGWRDRYGRIMPLSLLKKAKSMVYDKHKEILTKLSGPLRKDRIIMGFMSLVLLFDPQDNLKHTNSVGLDNLIYLCILRKYLIGTQPDPLEKYERLVEATQVINACNEEYNVFFSRNFQPEQITPLLIEIFDISINNSV